MVDQTTGLFTEAGTEQVKEKMRTVLRLGRCRAMGGNGLEGDGDNDAIVLGAWGCGAFRNPPTEVARCFKEVLTEDDMIGLYKRVVFAIIADRTENLATFRQVLCGLPPASAEEGEPRESTGTGSAKADVKIFLRRHGKAEYTESICAALSASAFAEGDWL